MARDAEYFSALGNGLSQKWPEVERYECGRGVAFRHDLKNGVPQEMMSAAVWYSDLPWRHGYEKFAARAGTTQAVPFREFNEKIGREIADSGKPACMVAGSQVGRYLKPQASAPAILNGGAAVAFLWGLQPWNEPKDAWEILRMLAAEYASVGDFCCGYGRAGKVFARAGGMFVLSDMSAECVGFIQAHAEGWSS